jgi:hypothetical protein
MLSDKELKRYETLLKSAVDVRWTDADVRALLDEIHRLKGQPQMPDHWAVRTRFVGGH